MFDWPETLHIVMSVVVDTQAVWCMVYSKYESYF
jgi:hypothetical protein